MLHELRFHTGTVELNYAEGPPSAPPFALLHAGGTRWQDGEALLGLLAARWHVYAPDLRGHGTLGRTPGRYRLRDYAMDIAAFLTHVVTEPAVLFGHSLSGTIAAMVAAQHPQSVRALVLGDVAPFAEGHARWAAAQRDVLLRLRDLASSGRSVAEIEAALKEIPLPVAGQAAPVRAEDAFGPDHPWFPAMAGHLRQLDPTMVMGVLDDGMMDGYDANQWLPQIVCPSGFHEKEPDCESTLPNRSGRRRPTRAAARPPGRDEDRGMIYAHPLVHLRLHRPLLGAHVRLVPPVTMGGEVVEITENMVGCPCGPEAQGHH